MKTTYFLLATSAMLVSACAERNPQASSQNAAEITTLRDKIKAQENDISDIRKQLATISRQLLAVDVKQDAYKSVTIDPAAGEGFSRMDTSLATITISVKDVKPFADGSQIYLTIGNISSATITAGSLNIKYGSRMVTYENGDTEFSDKYASWYNSLHEKVFQISNPIYPGAWNTVRIVLPAVKPADLGYINFTGDITQISMRKM